MRLLKILIFKILKFNDNKIDIHNYNNKINKKIKINLFKAKNLYLINIILKI